MAFLGTINPNRMALKKQLIIGTVGEIASGKGTVTEYLKEKYSASSYRFSTPLFDILNRLCLEVNRDNLPALSLALRQAFGQDLLAEVLNKEIAKDEHEIIVVDGIRREADMKYLKELEGFRLVYVTADMKLRYERLTARTEKDDDQKSFEEFVKDHSKETEVAIPIIGQQADYTIINEGSLEEFHQKIDEIIKKELA